MSARGRTHCHEVTTQRKTRHKVPRMFCRHDTCTHVLRCPLFRCNLGAALLPHCHASGEVGASWRRFHAEHKQLRQSNVELGFPTQRPFCPFDRHMRPRTAAHARPTAAHAHTHTPHSSACTTHSSAHTTHSSARTTHSSAHTAHSSGSAASVHGDTHCSSNNARAQRSVFADAQSRHGTRKTQQNLNAAATVVVASMAADAH